MAVDYQVVKFAKDTSGVDGTVQDVALNFTPKGLILLTLGDWRDSLFNDTLRNFMSYGIGFSDGTNNAFVYTESYDNFAVGTPARSHHDDAAVVFYTSSNTVDDRATCTFGTNKVTFTWTLLGTTAKDIIVIAFGGSDITNVKVNTVAVGTTATGDMDYTGLGFTPDLADSILFTAESSTTTLNTYAFGGALSFGAAISSTKRWVNGIASENASDPTDTWRFHSTDACLESLIVTTGAVDYKADFVDWIADGFRINYSDAPASSTSKFTYMVIKGGSWDVGSLQSPTSVTNDVDTTVSVGSNTLRGLFMGTVATATLSTVQTFALGSYGAADAVSGSQATVGFIDEDAQATTDTNGLGNTINIMKPLTLNGATMELATFDSFPSTSAFRLDWTTVDVGSRYYGWVVVADAAAAPPPAGGEGNGQMNFTADSTVGVFH